MFKPNYIDSSGQQQTFEKKHSENNKLSKKYTRKRYSVAEKSEG